MFSADASNLQGSNGQTWTVYFDFKDETSILSEGDIIYFAFVIRDILLIIGE